LNKEEYYKISLESGVQKRCPILEYCSRRAYSIYYFSYYKIIGHSDSVNSFLMREGVLPKDFDEKHFPLSGESPTYLKGYTYGSFTNFCPEVNLFDGGNSFTGFNGRACTSGGWETEGLGYTDIREEKHFTECAEYSKYMSEIENKRKMSIINNNNNTGKIQIQIDSDNSSQKIDSNNEQDSSALFLEFYKLLKSDLSEKNSEEVNDLNKELERTKELLEKGKDVKNRFPVIGDLMKDISINTFASLIASPIYETVKPLLGI